MRKIPLFGLILALGLASIAAAAPASPLHHALVLSAGKRPVFSSADELITAVNELRVSRGLAPFQANSILMAIAQTHAEYLASIRVSNTHIDAYGRRPFQRALDAGYMVAGDLSQGGWFSENVVGGVGLDAQGAMEIWLGSAPHMLTMLSEVLQDVGAGVAVYGNTYYYVLDAGKSTGGTPVAYTPPAYVNAPSPTIVPNTPKADGSIVHIVHPGDTLLAISIAYQVPYSNFLGLNGLTEKSIIYPDQEIIIRAAYTPTPTPPTSTPTGRPTSTLWPTSTATYTATPAPPTPTRSPGLAVPAAATAAGIIVLAALIAAGILALAGKKRR